MSANVIDIVGHLTDRILCNEQGAPRTLPPFYPTLYSFRLLLVDRDRQGRVALVHPNITDLQASVGLVYAQPRAGNFKLRYGTGTPTVPILFNESADDMRAKLIALTESTTFGLQELYLAAPSTWMLRFDNPVSSPLNGVENELEPETFIRINDFLQNGEIWNEVRLLQGPIASNDLFDHILADPPTTRRIRSGNTVDDGFTTLLINEVQAVTVPSDFLGTYALKFQGRQTKLLSRNDGPAVLQNALNLIYNDKIDRFSVTNPELNNAYVEFIGPFSGKPQPLLEIVIGSVGIAELFFKLDFATTEVAAALRANASVDTILEIKLHVTDPAVPGDPGKDLILFQAQVKVQRPLQWDGLLSAPPIDWLFPPNRTDYVPFDINQVITGQQSYSISFGDGVLNTYTIVHDLNSEALSVEVRENISNGRKLSDEEYEIHFTNNNSLNVIVSGSPPATNALLVSVFASGPKSAFQNHTHAIAHVLGLQAVIDQLTAQITLLWELLPDQLPGGGGGGGGPDPFGGSSTADILDFTLNDKVNLIPVTRLPSTLTLSSLKDDNKNIPRASLLLPAIHEAIALNEFTADESTDEITIATHGLIAGRRVHIIPPEFYSLGTCTIDSDTDIFTLAGHGLTDGRQVRFSITGTMPGGLFTNVTYYVVNATTDTFQVETAVGAGPANATSNATGTLTLFTISELPSPLDAGTDYFVVAPTTNTFKLTSVYGGSAIDITSNGIEPFEMVTIANVTIPLPLPDITNQGKAFSVTEDILLTGGTGIRSETVHAGDIIASDGRVWYRATRSDSPSDNSFYPAVMERELFRIAINETMLKLSSTVTVTFQLLLQMFKQNANVQYVLVVEVADTPADYIPSPLGPNLEDVIWNKTPVLQQRIIITDTSIKHSFGVQVIRKADGTMRTNQKSYSVVQAGDAIPVGPTFAMRGRLIEFDTENNIQNATGLVYYSLSSGKVKITTGAVPALASA